MELSEAISVRRFLEFTQAQKDELCTTLLELAPVVDELPKRSLKKTLEISLAALQYKYEQFENNESEKILERMIRENDKLKEMLDKLEKENVNYKQKIKSLTEEIFQAQKRLGEGTQPSELSDKDSSDPLSELDKQEDLLRNIDMKNKHIRRLIHDIELLQNENIDLSKTLIAHENEAQQKKQELQTAVQQQHDMEHEIKSLKEHNNALKLEIVRLESNVTYLEEEREKTQAELQEFMLKFEEKSHNWRQQLEEKELELQQLRTQSTATNSTSQYNMCDKDATEATAQIDKDYSNFLGALNKRDQMIEQLEAKIKSMAAEMLNSTEVMNKLNNEQDAFNLRRISNACCKLTEQSLQAANERSSELSEMLLRCEEENRLQAQRLQQALGSLEAYQRGEDGLAKALRKCSAVERKLMARDKQIRALVQELNELQDVAQQNQVLRKRLGLTAEEEVNTKHLSAKQRNKEKIIDQLTLKLRASEELRLQLQLDITQLRKELLEMSKLSAETQGYQREVTPKKSRKEVSEIGEVEDSSQVDTEEQLPGKLGQYTTENLQMEPLEGPHKYHELLMENETLRSGMLEILEKLQAYSETSTFINIDLQMLQKLLNVLQPQAAMAENAELVSNSVANSTSSLQEVRSCPPPEKSSDTLATLDFAPIDTSTRPTTPCLDVNESIVLPVIDDVLISKVVTCELDYKALFEQLKLQLNTSDCEAKAVCAQHIEDAANKQLELKKQKCIYEYLQQELDNTLNIYKEKELRHIKLVSELRQTINEQHMLHKQLELAFEQYKKDYQYSNDEFREIQQAQQYNQAQLANIVNLVLDGEISEQFRIQDLCVDYGIIEEELNIKYVTAQEYTEQQASQREAIEKYEEIKRQLSNVEGLLRIAQDQIKSQQKLINELTDNHINLRHLVADLQSSNEEKFLLAKMQRELDAAKREIHSLKEKREALSEKCDQLERNLQATQKRKESINQQIVQERNNNSLKIRYLEKSLWILKDKYAKFTPLVFLSNFVYAHTKFIKSASLQTDYPKNALANINEIIDAYLKDSTNETFKAPNNIKCVRLESRCVYLEENINSLKQRCQNLEMELNDLRIRYATENEHWRTIEALYVDRTTMVAEKNLISNANKAAQTSTETRYVDRALSPLTAPTSTIVNKNGHTNEKSTQTIAKNKPLAENNIKESVTQTAVIEVENQSVQTAMVNSVESASCELEKQQNLLIQKTQELKTANLRVEKLEKEMTEMQLELDKQKSYGVLEPNSLGNQTDIIEKTIISFHKLLSEKDVSIGKYQELLQNQRDHTQASSAKLETELESLKSTVSNLNFNIKTKDVEIGELKQQLNMLSNELKEKHTLLVSKMSGPEMSGENSLNEMTDEKLEEMFQEQDVTQQKQQQVVVNTKLQDIIEKQDNETLKEEPTVYKRIKELKDKLIYFEQTQQVKDEEINLLREKLSFYQEREKQEQNSMSPEIEQLRVILEEKDKHINDLMNTVRSFHDDQERFLNDATNYSADQLAKLAADLKRSETTNQIYQTQLEAMRRQLNSMSQREKQTRELNVTLRNELIKRPVVSIKTELNARVKNENLQKRIQQLESELDECRAQLQRQQAIIDAKRVKSANEVNLWEKQKRWQQNAEKLKIKLDDTELALEKTRTLLQSARNTISRLEKEKHTLETKFNKVMTGCNNNNLVNMKCCRTPSCPNLQQNSAKYTPSETPETYTGVSSESSSPAHSANTARSVNNAKSTHMCTMLEAHTHHVSNNGVGSGAANGEFLVEALKARIELQQRKLLAMEMEMEGKGNNVLSTEIEKLQERLSATDAQNIRLEAKNLQLQLDNDLLRQGDTSERLQKRIKHLEDYIIALKEEMAAVETRSQMCTCNGRTKLNSGNSSPAPGSHAEAKNSANQTIMTLRNIVEKLRTENKYLKDSKRTADVQSNEQLTIQLKNLQKKHAEAIEKIAQLNKELEKSIQNCDCATRKKAPKHACDELKFIKEQLTKKTQLLQKAKVLLTRAAAKEKVLKEQVALWKRKCSELQNVPVIEEISE